MPFDYTRIKRAIEAANAEVAEADRLSDTMVGFVNLNSDLKYFSKKKSAYLIANYDKRLLVFHQIIVRYRTGTSFI